MSLVSDLRRVALAGLLLLSALPAAADMQALEDSELTDVSAQAGSLFIADRIGPNELTNPDPSGYSNFTFYRVAMDVRLDMNMNIAKFQLGCGGVNDYLTGTGVCDLDLDYVGFMGINANNDRPATNGPDSVFTLTRPYVEFAVKNDGTATREIVGLKVGAQKINGAIRIGRDYLGISTLGNESNLVNQEHGGTCSTTATTGAGVLNCHSGVNALSGFLAGIEISAGFQAQATIRDILTLLIPISLNVDACVGRLNNSPNWPCTPSSTPFFVDAGGTRLQNLNVAAAPLTMRTDFGGITLSGYGGLNLGLRQIHYLLAPNSGDFFLSYQRERVAWPRYEKRAPTVPQGTPPGARTTVPGTAAQEPYFTSCNTTWGQVPTNGRCTSAYAEPANTGWWLNAADMKMLNLAPGNRITLPGTMTVGELLAALGPDSSPIVITDPRLDFVAQRNCYGSQLFC